jgi:hypothetical protein
MMCALPVWYVWLIIIRVRDILSVIDITHCAASISPKRDSVL